MFVEKVQLLSEPGHWNTDLGDCMPLVIANVLNSTVQIYSSIITRPVLEVKTDLVYIACAGHEHYDGTVPLCANENVPLTDANDKNQPSPGEM